MARITFDFVQPLVFYPTSSTAQMWIQDMFDGGLVTPYQIQFGASQSPFMLKAVEVSLIIDVPGPPQYYFGAELVSMRMNAVDQAGSPVLSQGTISFAAPLAQGNSKAVITKGYTLLKEPMMCPGGITIDRLVYQSNRFTTTGSETMIGSITLIGE